MAEVNLPAPLQPREVRLSLQDMPNSKQIELADAPRQGTLRVMRNGVETREGSDYAVSNKVLTIKFPVSERTKIVIKYLIRRE